MSIVTDPFDVDIRIAEGASGGAAPASWTPARSRTIKCSKATCRGCTDTCASCGPGGIFC